MTDWGGRSGRGFDDARYERKESSLEFDRVAFFSDVVFAIAMTLLVVGIGIPEVRDSDLGDALRGKEAEIVSFFITALWSWILIWPLEVFTHKKLKPEGADEYFQ